MNNSSQFNFFSKLRESAGIRFCLLFGCFFIFLIITSIITLTVEGMPGSQRDHLLIDGVVQNLLAFCLPAFLLARFCSSHPFKWLKLDAGIRLKPVIGVIIMYVISMPALDWLTNWNAGISFPDSLKGLEEVLRNWENQALSSSQVLVHSQGAFSLIIGVLVVGVLTGFSEELFFRGGVQGIFIRTGIGVTGAVWCAAALFSAMHFQFFGFVPRLLMGVFFGYLLVWTNDIKVSAFAHILNNSMVMIMAAIYGEDVLTNLEISIYPDSNYMPLLSLISTTTFLIFCRGYFFKNQKTFNLPWQKRQLLPPSEN